MSFLPTVRDGAIVEPAKKVRKKRRKSLRKAGTNPRALGTNPRAQAKKLWQEHFEATEFIRKL